MQKPSSLSTTLKNCYLAVHVFVVGPVGHELLADAAEAGAGAVRGVVDAVAVGGAVLVLLVLAPAGDGHVDDDVVQLLLQLLDVLDGLRVVAGVVYDLHGSLVAAAVVVVNVVVVVGAEDGGAGGGQELAGALVSQQRVLPGGRDPGKENVRVLVVALFTCGEADRS